MNVNPVGAVPQAPVKKNSTLKAARNGALITSGVFTTATGLSFLTRKTDMMQVVNDCGGKKEYAKTFILGMAILSTVGAGVNALLNVISKKIAPKEQPKAAN